jgi:PAS domain S-box-containing protein
MKKRQVVFRILFIFAITGFLSCLIVYGSSDVRAFFDGSNDFYQIRKSVVWGVIISFFLILVLAQTIVLITVNRRKNAEVSLMGSEEVLTTLINGTPDLIFFKDAEGRYLEINDSMLEIFGFSTKNYKGKQKQELDESSLLYKSVSGSCLISDEKAWGKGSIFRTTEILDMLDGAKRIYDVIKAPIFYKDGRRKGIVTMARDITTYKKAEEKLEKKEKILRATLNATDNGILVVDNKRHVLEANDLFYNMWNIPFDVYSLNSATANQKLIMKQLVDPETFETWVNFVYEVPVTDHYTAELLDKSVYDIFSTPLMDKEHMIGRVWSCRDITARVNAERELHKSEERYRTLVELSPDAIFVSVEGKVVFTNMAGVKILNANKRENIYSRNIQDIMLYDTKVLTEKHFNGIINGEEKKSMFEHRLVRFDGICIDTESVCSVVPYRGEKAVMYVVRDISERKRNEELKRKIDENIKLVSETLEYDKLKTEFFANISHEVKTPLNIIIGSLQLLEYTLGGQNKQDNSDKLAKYAAIMRQNCFRLLRLLNNLIYFTEIDSGFVDMHVQNYDLVQIIKNLISSASKFIEDKGVQIELIMDSDNLEIACDAEKIERVLLNLLSNAVKFTEKGDKISVSLYSRNNFAYISVKDTGIGIPDEMKEVIFQRFRQVDKSFTRKREGSGIGLSLAKSLVEMHNGSIKVKSKCGKGSEFIVKLPLVLLDDNEIAATVEDTASICIDRIKIEFSDIY